MPLVWEDVVERNLDLVVRKGRRVRFVGAATARRGANRAVRVVDVRMPRPTRPVALDNDCLVILNGVSGTIGLDRERRESLAMLLKDVNKEEALRVDGLGDWGPGEGSLKLWAGQLARPPPPSHGSFPQLFRGHGRSPCVCRPGMTV